MYQAHLGIDVPPYDSMIAELAQNSPKNLWIFPKTNHRNNGEILYLYSPNFGQMGRWSPWVGTLSLGSNKIKFDF